TVPDGRDHRGGGPGPSGPHGGVRRGPARADRDPAVHVAAACERAGGNVHIQHHVADADEVHPRHTLPGRPPRDPAHAPAAAAAAHAPNAPQNGSRPGCSSGSATPPPPSLRPAPAGRTSPTTAAAIPPSASARR